MTPLPHPQPATGNRRLLFTCYHFHLDTSNGAAISSREILRLLARRGWEVRVLCGPLLDFFDGRQRIPQIIADRGITPQVTYGRSDGIDFSLLEFQDEQMQVEVFLPNTQNASQQHNHHPPTPGEGNVFLERHRQICELWRPHIVMTYGGFWMIEPLLQISHAFHAKTVFSLRNFAYKNAAMFHEVDLTLVPSQFASDWYAEKLGIKSTPIPSPIDWNTILCDNDISERKYVTFVNPDPNKGVYVFAQIAKQLWERRPDIPLLVVEGRAGADWLARTGVDLQGVGNMSPGCCASGIMANTPDPRDFYRVTKIMLVPSLFLESFGRVAAEAMMNGIPVVASNRGALPEVIGDAGITLEIPAQYTPETRIAPMPEEVEPWVNAIIHLWDNTTLYNELSAKGRSRANRWHPEIIARQYDDALARLIVS